MHLHKFNGENTCISFRKVDKNWLCSKGTLNFCGAVKTEEMFNQQMQFCLHTTQKLSVKQHPQKGLILFKKTKHCHVKQLSLPPVNNQLTSMKTNRKTSRL